MVRCSAALNYRAQWKLQRRLAGVQPVLVYSAGKVGTSSLAAVLGASLEVPVVHCHRIATKRTQMFLGREPIRPFQSAAAVRGDYIRKRLQRDTAGSWDIVCGVRDPVACAVSGLFQVSGRYGLFDEALPGPQLVRDVADLVAQMFDRGEAKLDWFDVELRATTGIDVYSEPFPHDVGFRIYEQGRFRVLLIRFEDLKSVAPFALSNFFDVEIPELPQTNVGGAKVYGDLYRTVLAEAQLPDELLDMVYRSKWATHFYTPTEIEAFRRGWSSGGPST